MRSLVAKTAVGLAALGMLMGVTNSSLAGEAALKKHNVVLQVSDDNETTFTYALNNAANVQKDLGIDNVNVELVAYGPGLKILTKESPVGDRVKSLALQNITFSACGNTMANIEKKTGKKPELVEGVRVVPGGVIRIMELQGQGYAYVKP